VEEQHEGAGDGEIKFRELAFEVETGEAEMIGVDFVATGGGNATAVPKADTTAAASSAQEAGSSKDKDKDKKTKGKGKAKDQTSDDAEPESTTSALSPEDEELIASLTAKANAIKMLNTRLNLIRSYLQTLPPSYLTAATSADAPADTTNYTLLRSINAMLSRLPLLTPPTTTAAKTTASDTSSQPSSLASAAEKEKQDVHLSTLLATLTRSIAEAQTMGMKFNVVNREKTAKERGPFGARGRGGMGFGDESALLAGDNGAF
jgi:COP9 signalosome complex subunit 6